MEKTYMVEYKKRSGQLSLDGRPTIKNDICRILQKGKHVQIVWGNTNKLALITIEPLFGDWMVHRPPLPSIPIKSYVTDVIKELQRRGGKIYIKTDNYYSQHS